MNNPEWILHASLDQVKSGYVETDEHYTCLCCGQRFEKGIIYPQDGVLYEAGKYTRRHIEQEHESVFAHLLSLDKSMTGLSEVQKRLLALFYVGKSDTEVQKELGIGATSTIRNHRFLLKEKERQAKVFLAIMELLRARDKQAPANAEPLTGSKGERVRGATTEQDKVLRKYFPYGTEGPLKSFPVAEKPKRIVLGEIVKRFENGRTYTETEVNQVLEAVFEDYVALRRSLVDYGFMNRLPDGSQYWRNESADEREESHVDRKAELKQFAKEIKTDAGVYQIKNNRNGKALVESTRNLKTINGQQFQLELGSHTNKMLQQDWNECGKEAFTFEVLEVLDKEKMAPLDEQDALKKLKEQWLERLQPFGERGYNPIRGEK